MRATLAARAWVSTHSRLSVMALRSRVWAPPSSHSAFCPGLHHHEGRAVGGHLSFP